MAAAASGDQQGVADCGASVPRFALRAIGIDHMRQENEGTHHADSHRNQLNHRTHRGHASPRSIKGALPFQYMAQKNVFGRPGRRRNLVSPCDRLAAGLGTAPMLDRPGRTAHIRYATHSPAKAPIPLHSTPATDNISPPQSAGTKPPIVEPIKIAIQVRDITQLLGRGASVPRSLSERHKEEQGEADRER
jgi:hypothetical protein